MPVRLLVYLIIVATNMHHVTTLGHVFSVAPMMKHTHRHFIHFWQTALNPDAKLYSEMISAHSIVDAEKYGVPIDKIIGYSDVIIPPILQLGGRCPVALSHAAKIAYARGYQSINLNCGCPSNAVASQNMMGAALMREPLHTALSIHSICSAVPNAEVSVKCRIGVDEMDSYENLHFFISSISDAGATLIQLHARKALLDHSPLSNRDIPPLRYDIVYQIARDFPNLRVELNGGVDSFEAMNEHLSHCPDLAGVMIGRACINHPYSFSNAQITKRSRGDMLHTYIDYCSSLPPSSSSAEVERIISPVFSLFAGEEGNGKFRRSLAKMLSNGVTNPTVLLRQAVKDVPLSVQQSLTYRPIAEIWAESPWLSKSPKRSGPMRAQIS